MKSLWFDLPTWLVVIVLVLLLLYGMLSFVTDGEPDPIRFTAQEQQLDSQQWLEVYEKKKRQREQQRQNRFLNIFAPEK